MFLVFVPIPDWYKTQETFGRSSEDPFMIIYCLNSYIAQIMCREAADDCLAALRFIPDCFVMSKMLKFYNALLADDDILFCNEDFNQVTSFANQVDILAVDFYKINIDEYNNFDENDPDSNIHSDFWLDIVN